MSTVYKHYRRPTDLGTPEVTSDKDVTLTIDGKQATVPDGTTVLRAAALSGINIPKLCASDMLEPFGSCRLCLVESGLDPKVIRHEPQRSPRCSRPLCVLIGPRELQL